MLLLSCLILQCLWRGVKGRHHWFSLDSRALGQSCGGAGAGELWLDHRSLCNWIYPNGTEVMEQGLLHGPRSVRPISSKRAGCSGCVLSPFFNLAIFSLRTQGSLTP